MISLCVVTVALTIALLAKNQQLRDLRTKVDPVHRTAMVEWSRDIANRITSIGVWHGSKGSGISPDTVTIRLREIATMLERHDKRGIHVYIKRGNASIERVEQFLQAMRKLAVSMDHLMEVEDNE